MATTTMYFSRTGSYTTQNQYDSVDFTPSESVYFGSTYRVTSAEVNVTSGLVSGTSAGRDCVVIIEFCSGTEWYSVYTGSVYLTGSGTTGGYSFGSITIPADYQTIFATNGISDIRFSQGGDFSIRGKDGAEGYVTFTYEEVTVQLDPPTNLSVTQDDTDIVVSWTAPSYSGGSGSISYRVDMNDSNGNTVYSEMHDSSPVTIPIPDDSYYGTEISVQVGANYSGMWSWSTVCRLTLEQAATGVYYAQNGVWRQCDVYYGHNGVWRQCDVYYGHNGVWRQC